MVQLKASCTFPTTKALNNGFNPYNSKTYPFTVDNVVEKYYITQRFFHGRPQGVICTFHFDLYNIHNLQYQFQ